MDKALAKELENDVKRILTNLDIADPNITISSIPRSVMSGLPEKRAGVVWDPMDGLVVDGINDEKIPPGKWIVVLHGTDGKNAKVTLPD